MLSVGLFVCLGVHFLVAYLVAKRLRLTQPAGPESRERSGRVWLSQLAGTLAAYVVSVALFFTTLQVAGTAASTTRIVVSPDKPAAAAGLRSGDRVVSIGGVPVSEWEGVKSRILAAPRDASTAIVAERAGQLITMQVTPDASGRIGIQPSEARAERAWQSSIGPALASPIVEPLRALRGIWNSVSGESAATLQGPIGILRSTGGVARPFWKTLFIMLAPSVAIAWPATLLAAVIFVPRRRGQLSDPGNHARRP